MASIINTVLSVLKPYIRCPNRSSMVQNMYKMLHEEQYDMLGRGQERQEGNLVMLNLNWTNTGVTSCFYIYNI